MDMPMSVAYEYGGFSFESRENPSRASRLVFLGRFFLPSSSTGAHSRPETAGARKGVVSENAGAIHRGDFMRELGFWNTGGCCCCGDENAGDMRRLRAAELASEVRTGVSKTEWLRLA